MAPGPDKELKNWAANKKIKAFFATTYPSPNKCNISSEKKKRMLNTQMLIKKIILVECLISCCKL